MTTPTVQPVYASPTALTNAIQSLASSGTFVAGYESDLIDNTTTKYGDVIVSGKVTVGTSPTTGTQILIYIVPAIDPSGTTWPDVFDGTTSAETVTSAGVARGYSTLAKILDVDSTTSDRAYAYSFSIRNVLGYMPQKCVLFTTHNTAVNLNSTGSNQVTTIQGYNDAIPSV